MNNPYSDSPNFFLLFLVIFVNGLAWTNCLCVDAVAVVNRQFEGGRGQNAIVMIRVFGLNPPRGTLRLSLYGSEETYRNRTNPVRSTSVPVRGREVTVKFTGLKEGWYAIMFYHDANNNGKFDTVLKIPEEQFGFSNNVPPGLSGPPSFKRTRFFMPGGKTVVIVLKAQ